MSQMQSTIAMPEFDHNVFVAAERRYNKLLKEQRSRRQAVGDFQETERLENLQREKDRFKREMPLPMFDRYIQNVYQREREIKEGREREMNRGTPAWNGPSLTPSMGLFQNGWQGLPNPRVATGPVSTANANGHGLGVGQRPFLQIASAFNANMNGHCVDDGSQLSAGAVSPASSANEGGQIAGGSPPSDRQWNPEAKAFQPGVVAAPETCSQPSSEQPSLTPATPENVPIESRERRDSGYGSHPTSPTKSESGTKQEAPEETGIKIPEKSLGKEQGQPAAAKVAPSEGRQNLTTLPGRRLKITNGSFLGSWVPRILREGYDERCERILEDLEQWDANRTKIRAPRYFSTKFGFDY